MDTRHEHDTHSHTTSPLRAPSRGVPIPTPEGAPLSSAFFLLLAFRRLSDGATGAGPGLPSSPFSAAAPPPFRPLRPIPSTPPPATPPPTPWARAVASGRPTSPPRSHPSLVGKSRPHPRPLYRPRLAPPLRRFLFRLGEALPSLSKITVVRLPMRRASSRHPRTSRFHSQRPRQLISRPLRKLTQSSCGRRSGAPLGALRTISLVAHPANSLLLIHSCNQRWLF